MSLPNKPEGYYHKLHQTISDETGVAIGIVQYIRGAIGGRTKEDLIKHIEERTKNQERIVGILTRRLENPKYMAKKTAQQRDEMVSHLTNTKAQLDFRKSIIEVLKGDEATLLKVLRKDE